MRDMEKTIGNLIDKASVSIISSVDEEGIQKQCFSQGRGRV